MVYRRKSVDSGTYIDDTVYVSGWTEESQQPKSESQRLLDRVSDLISSLHHVQNTRLSSQPPDHLSDVSGPSSEESELGNFHQFYAVMLSPRGQAGLEAKILYSASKNCPWHVLELFILASRKISVMTELLIIVSLQ